MTIKEALAILVNRIGFEDDKTVTGFTPSAPVLLTDSGRYFQQEHSAVTLQNIRDCQPVPKISTAEFNLYLQRLKIQACQKVLNDAFERDYLNDKLFELYPTGFDSAVSLQMVIIVSELIITSTRSNRVERLNDDFVGKLNYDIFREAPNKFAIRGANYNYSLGVATRYGFEITSVRRRFGTVRNLLKSVTKGDAITSLLHEEDKDSSYYE